MKEIKSLIKHLPQQGVVEWIGLRPARRETINVVKRVTATTEAGLLGDRYAGRSGKRQVTLIQQEHLAVVASCLGIEKVKPEWVRRNIAVSGINLLALKDKQFQVGDAILEYTGLCHPCSYMEELFGEGGYNAMRGHGGITARVIQSGEMGLGDAVISLSAI